MTTKVDDLIVEKQRVVDLKSLNNQELHDLICDLSKEQQTRFEAIKLYFDNMGEELTLELINKFCLMYQFSGSSVLQNFLSIICLNKSNLNSLFKSVCAKSLISFTESIETIEEDDEIKDIKLESNKQIQERNKQRMKLGYKCLNAVCSSFNDLPTPTKVELLLNLVLCETYKKESIKYFCDFVNNQDIDCDYRYKIMLSLERKNIPSKNDFLKTIFLSFLNENKNMTMYKILCAQYLLQNNSNGGLFYLDKETCDTIEQIILSFAEDEELDFNLRADAADLILNIGDKHRKIRAREIIMILGRTINSNSISVFDNSQNVHTREIEKSLIDTLEHLVKIPTYEVDNKPINFKWIHDKIQNLFVIPEKKLCVYDKNLCPHSLCHLCCSCLSKHEFEPFEVMIYSSLREDNETDVFCKSEKKFCNDTCFDIYNYIDKVNISLNRIFLDRILYSKYNQTLLNILIKVVSFIYNHDYKDELMNRLKEELYDMSGTCSTGFASRLINTLSGYDNFNIKISFKDQIISNFIARINKKMQNIITNQEYYTTKHREIVWIYMKTENMSFKKESKEDLLNQEIDKESLIDNFLKENKKEKIQMAVEDFADNVLIEIMERNSYVNRPYFIKFFRDTIPSVKEELYDEFKKYVTDTEFDLAIKDGILNYETSD